MSASVRGLSELFMPAGRPTGKLLALSGLLLGVASLASLPLIFPAAPMSRHMATHILLMDAVAPFVAILLFPLASKFVPPRSLQSSVALSTSVQIIVLWSAHAPAVMNAGMHSPALGAGTQGALLLTALWFWTTILAQRGADMWRAILALLVTGKLFCLLGAILTFAPRTLYLDHGMPGHGMSALQDQQLAGLLMVVACPLAYVLTGVVLSARWLLGLSGRAETTVAGGR